MTIPATIDVHMDPFCNCKGCIEKVKKALGKLDDVILLAMDPNIGIFTILTTKHPQLIEYALKHSFPRKNITLSQETSHVPHVDDIATTLMTMSHIQGLKNMEYTKSNTFKFNFTNGHNQPTLSLMYHINSTIFEVLMAFTLNMIHYRRYHHKLMSRHLLRLFPQFYGYP
ncbi:hypothetical protein Hanom_Chr14g01323821 [Helianthus anomalus]